ncbi:glycosyltransferase [Bacillus cereus]
MALESAVKQTYKNIEIIITDDSTNNETYNCIQPYFKNITIFIMIKTLL